MKTQIRQGLFETSSSSEDSLSVYQEMNLYIVSKDQYNLFMFNKGYYRFENTIPIFSDDEDYIYEYNLNYLTSRKGYEHIVEQYKETRTFKHLNYHLIKDYLPYIFISYDEYVYMVKNYYYDYDFFDYDNDSQKIFGFYGYNYC